MNCPKECDPQNPRYQDPQIAQGLFARQADVNGDTVAAAQRFLRQR
jgi:hypothetical protein